MKYCTSCGKELKENSEFCIECGQRVVKLNNKNSNYNGLSIASFIIGIFCIVFSIIVGSNLVSRSRMSILSSGSKTIEYSFLSLIVMIASIVGIVFGAIGIAKKNQNEKHVLALIGLIISIMAFLICFSSCASCLH